MIDRLEVELFGQSAGELRISGPLRSPEDWAAFADAAGYRDEARMRRVMDAIAHNVRKVGKGRSQG